MSAKVLLFSTKLCLHISCDIIQGYLLSRGIYYPGVSISSFICSIIAESKSRKPRPKIIKICLRDNYLRFFFGKMNDKDDIAGILHNSPPPTPPGWDDFWWIWEEKWKMWNQKASFLWFFRKIFTPATLLPQLSGCYSSYLVCINLLWVYMKNICRNFIKETTVVRNY